MIKQANLEIHSIWKVILPSWLQDLLSDGSCLIYDIWQVTKYIENRVFLCSVPPDIRWVNLTLEKGGIWQDSEPSDRLLVCQIGLVRDGWWRSRLVGWCPGYLSTVYTAVTASEHIYMQCTCLCVRNRDTPLYLSTYSHAAVSMIPTSQDTSFQPLTAVHIYGG